MFFKLLISFFSSIVQFFVLKTFEILTRPYWFLRVGLATFLPMWLIKQQNDFYSKFLVHFLTQQHHNLIFIFIYNKNISSPYSYEVLSLLGSFNLTTIRIYHYYVGETNEFSLCKTFLGPFCLNTYNV